MISELSVNLMREREDDDFIIDTIPRDWKLITCAD